ncbi:unnamed protein product [Brassica oleracea]
MLPPPAVLYNHPRKMKKLEMELLIKDQEMLMKEYSTGMRTFMFYSGFIEEFR